MCGQFYTMPQLLIFGLVIGAFLLYQKAAAAGSFLVRVVGFGLDIRRATLFAVPFTVKIEIENPSNDILKIDAVAGSVFLGTTEVGAFRNLSGFQVQAKSKNAVEFAGTLSPAAALKSGVNLVQSIQSGKLPAMIIKGSANAGGFIVPFSQIIEN